MTEKFRQEERSSKWKSEVEERVGRCKMAAAEENALEPKVGRLCKASAR